MKKKIVVIIIVIIIIIMAIIIGIMQKNNNKTIEINVEDLATKMQQSGAFEDELVKIDSEMIMNDYNFTTDEVEEFVSYQGSGATSEEIVILKVKDKSDLNSIKDKINARIAERKEAFQSYLPKEVGKIDNNVLIIYVTSYESYMLESFSVRPFRFIIKPLNEQELHSCFKAAFDDISNSDSYFRYNYQRIRHKIPIRDILYFQSNRRKIKIVTQENVFEFYGKLNDIETSLINSKAVFLRVHQSFLVNYKHVKGLSYDFLVLDNGKYISISEDRRKQISEQYCAMEDVFYVNI